jgi:glycine betaine transporter
MTRKAEAAGAKPIGDPAKGLAGVCFNPTMIISSGVIILFVALAMFDLGLTKQLVNSGFAWSAKLFGAYWQVLILFTFFIGLGLAVSRAGNVRLGGTDAPEMSTFQWVAIILCTLLAGGGVFWAAAEPIAHFTSPPPLFGGTAKTAAMVYPALAQSFMHWGFLAWAILGSLASIVLMHLHHAKGLPLQPRTLLYPVFGDRVMTGLFGGIVDASCIVAVAAGTIGPIGFFGLQVSYGLNDLFGIPNVYLTQVLALAAVVGLYTISAVTGIGRGIQLLSRFNVYLVLALLAFILVFGPTAFIIDSYVQGFGLYITKFIPMATFRADTAWLGWWTIFFWGWFLGYAPLMAVFISRISRGRTIREIVLAVAILAPVATTFWFTAVGGSGLFFELATPGSVSGPFVGFNFPAALFAITKQFPFGFLLSLAFLVLTTIFVATSGDSMTYAISMVVSGDEHPHSSIRVFWGVAMGVVAAVLISIGSGGVSALQSFIVVTAVPVSLIMLPSLWNAPMIARELAREQGLIKK